jgi:DNA ligase 1
MSDPCDSIIRSLEDHPSRLNKEDIIRVQAEAGHTEFFKGVRLALDPMVTFGVKKVPTHSGPDGQGLPWTVFEDLADKLAKRELTGHDARDAIELCLAIAKKNEWNDWYRRILIKDLRCGTSDKTINKVVEKKYADYAIPVFGCQLAHDSANHESKVAGKKLIEVKLDGVRVITVVRSDGRVDMFSRNGKELANFPHITEQISNVVKTHGSSNNMDVVLDGEIMSSSFQDLMKQVHRKDNVEADDAILNLFDVLPLEDFEKGIWNKSQSDRSDMVYYWHKTYKDMLPNITVVGHELVDLDTAEGSKRFKEINQKAIDGGYEGIMIKDPDAPYECKRTASWLKLKPFIEVSLEVKDVEEGTGRNVGRLGALVCEGDDDARHIRVNVGSGFSDDDRNTFWNSRSDVLGRIVEVRADAITQNQDGTYSLRFPRFLHFRGFEIGEKI